MRQERKRLKKVDEINSRDIVKWIHVLICPNASQIKVKFIYYCGRLCVLMAKLSSLSISMSFAV